MPPDHPPTPATRYVRGRLLLDPSRPPTPGWIELENGRIAAIHQGEPPASIADPRITIGGPDRLISPAFTDAHFHFPQFGHTGCDGLPLLEWLQRVVYPAEIWWGNGGAMPTALAAARELIRQGTVAVAGYLTSHAAISHAAAEALAAKTPLRLILGRVAMDREAPEALTREDRERATMRPIPSPVIAPYGRRDGAHRSAATPRFAISCTEELLAETGWKVREAAASGSPLDVQTHLSESLPECARVRELFPSDPHYTAVYDRLGLLTDRTVLAHCVHLSDDEWRLVVQRRAIVAHCPTANLFLRSGFFNLDKAREHGVRVCLGSDVAGGPDVAMPRVARAMIESAKARALAGAAAYVPTPAQAWAQITTSNARELGWPDLGELRVGTAATLLVLRPPATWFDEHLLGRLIYGWSAELIEHRIIAGAVVRPDTMPLAC